jgi:hypothetical protein
MRMWFLQPEGVQIQTFSLFVQHKDGAALMVSERKKVKKNKQICMYVF